MVKSDPVTTNSTFSVAMTAARNGEDWAWREFYTSLIGPMTGYLRARGAREPEDLAAESFLQAARNIDQFEGDESAFRSWMFVIAHRRLIDERRRRGRRPETTWKPAEPAGGNVEHEAMAQVQLGEVHKVLAHLTGDQREGVTLRVIGDLSLAETAEILDKDVGAIKALQHRAINTLRRLIDDGTVSL